MTEIRYLPQQDKRVETGVTQFGDDWPGVFIRGDSAMHYGMTLAWLDGQLTDPLQKITLAGLRELLLSCDERRLRAK